MKYQTWLRNSLAVTFSGLITSGKGHLIQRTEFPHSGLHECKFFIKQFNIVWEKMQELSTFKWIPGNLACLGNYNKELLCGLHSLLYYLLQLAGTAINTHTWKKNWYAMKSRQPWYLNPLLLFKSSFSSLNNTILKHFQGRMLQEKIKSELQIQVTTPKFSSQYELQGCSFPNLNILAT